MNKTLSVGFETWQALKQRALDEGWTMGEVVAALLRGDGVRPREPMPVTKRTSAGVRPVPVLTDAPPMEPYTWPVVPADEVRCKVCGERLRDHRSGASGQVAIRTNCRRFVEP